jgi:hypothetical protein
VTSIQIYLRSLLIPLLNVLLAFAIFTTIWVNLNGWHDWIRISISIVGGVLGSFLLIRGIVYALEVLAGKLLENDQDGGESGAD